MYDYDLIRSRRKTLALELTWDDRLLVRAPLHADKQRIDAFVAKEEHWIRRRLEQRQQRRAAAPPMVDSDDPDLLRARAREILPAKVALWAAKMGLSPSAVKITTARKRYGSCNGADRLCFSCFLLQQPEAAVDLVVVHELCHIPEKNHGPGFYALMDRWLPDHREREKLLR